jgi:hypothetical protein
VRGVALEARLAVHHILHRLLLVNRLRLRRPCRLTASERASSFPRSPRSRTELILRHNEGLDGENLAAEVGKGNASEGVESEDALEDAVGVVGDGEDGTEEVGVAEVGAESLVGGAGLLPGVAAASEVDEDDAERPDIVVRGGVGVEALEETALTLCGKKKVRKGRRKKDEKTTTNRDSCRKCYRIQSRSSYARPSQDRSRRA